MPAQDVRPAHLPLIVSIFVGSFVGLVAVVNIIASLISFDNPATGFFIVFAAAGAASQSWFAREKALPESGRLWRYALACGAVSAGISAALAVLGFSADEGIWREFSREGVVAIAIVFAVLLAVQVLIVRAGFWLTFRQAAKKAAA